MPFGHPSLKLLPQKKPVSRRVFRKGGEGCRQSARRQGPGQVESWPKMRSRMRGGGTPQNTSNWAVPGLAIALPRGLSWRYRNDERD